MRPGATKKERARVERQAGRVSELMGMAVSKGTSQGYEAVLKSVIPAVEKENGRTVLPMRRWDDFVAVFCELHRFWPTVEGKNGKPVVRWSAVKRLYAAVKFWHTVRGEHSILDRWDDRMKRVWHGLERDASHAVSDKVPLGVDSVKSILEQGALVGKQAFDNCPEGKVLSKGELLKLRTAAAVAIAFFGTRRQAEVASLRLGNCTWDPVSKGWNVWVESQKNDQCGVGQTCVVPSMPLWGDACPAEVIRMWYRVRQGPLVRMDREKRLSDRAVSRVPGQSPRDVLFPAVSGKFWGLEVSAQALTNALRREAGGKVAPSARKGGTQFYLAHGMGARATQVQAGWKSPRSLEQVYGKVVGSELQAAVSQAAGQAGQVWEARNCVKDILNLSFNEGSSASVVPDRETVTGVLGRLKTAEPLLSRMFVGARAEEFLGQLKRLVKFWNVKGEERNLCGRVYRVVEEGKPSVSMSRDAAGRAAAVERAAA